MASIMQCALLVLFFSVGCVLEASGAGGSTPECPGSFPVTGLGRTQIIPTGWPDVPAPVEVTGNGLTATHGSRAYFAQTCTAGLYSNRDYAALNLLGATMNFTVDLAGAGCGCNVALYLVSMRQNPNPSQCSDYYCDANDVCGESCAEIDIMEANTASFHSTLHTQFDHGGQGAGYGGGDGWNGPRDFTRDQYSEGGKCIDTTKPFQVSVSFPTDVNGAFASMDVTLSQAGSPCPLRLHLGSYPGNAEMGQALKNGMTPVISYWSSDKMLWMDGLGQDEKGPCASDPAAACLAKKPTLSDFSISPLGNGIRQNFNADTNFRYPRIDASAEEEKAMLLEALTDISYAIDDRTTTALPSIMTTVPMKPVETIEYKPMTADCPKSFDVPGLGSVSLVLSGWTQPSPLSAGAPVDVLDGALSPHLLSRAYFAESCSAGTYSNEQYLGIKFLGKTLKYTVDMSGAGCGCNVGLSLVSMKQNTQRGFCDDYYCNANSFCGVPCAEVNIQEANSHAWHTTLHSEYDHSGLAAGYGGGDGVNGPRDWSSEEYGPSGRCIDTGLPFDVEVSFPVSTEGGLRALVVNLTQTGKRCPLSITMSNYHSMSAISAALSAGMTPVLSYYKSDSILWLDGAGIDEKGGPCTQDLPSQCSASVSLSNFQVVGPEIEIPGPETHGMCVNDFILKQKCVYEFSFHGKQYTGCTSAESKGKFWCSYDAEYDGRWSWCDPCSEVVGGTAQAVVAPEAVGSTERTSDTHQTDAVHTNKTGEKLIKFQQCGGKTWNGPTQCDEGLVCQFMNEWYAMCEPFEKGSACFNGWLAPAECAHQFVYDDTEFTGCSTADSRFSPPRGWCSTDAKFGGNWMDCEPCAGEKGSARVILKNRGGALRGLGVERNAGYGAGIFLVFAVCVAGVAVALHRRRAGGSLAAMHRDPAPAFDRARLIETSPVEQE